MVKLTKHERHIRYQVEDGILYDVYSTIREEKANHILYTRFPDKHKLDDVDIDIMETMIIQDAKRVFDINQLVKLQSELGYKEGELSTVAMLGLVGETGEVLAETRLRHDGQGHEQLSWLREESISYAKKLDTVKKRVRKGLSEVCIVVQDSELPDFKSELADTFYYLNILATNVGLTIYDLAEMAHDKVRAKQAAGGSSEDPKS